MRFLVVYDSTTTRRMVAKILKDIGDNNVVESANGKDAFAKMYLEKVDFIITDWNMPEMNGMQFVKMVKNESEFKDILILMITTRSFKVDIVSALKAGVCSYLIKPSKAKELEKRICEVLK